MKQQNIYREIVQLKKRQHTRDVFFGWQIAKTIAVKQPKNKIQQIEAKTDLVRKFTTKRTSVESRKKKEVEGKRTKNG